MSNIIEAIENARYNLYKPISPIQTAIGLKQLDNALYLLKKGYPVETDIEEIIEKYNDIENVPEYSEHTKNY